MSLGVTESKKPAPLTPDQQALIVVTNVLDASEKKEIKVGLIGLIGLGLLGGVGYLLWRRR